MSSGIVILRALRNLTIGNSLKYPSSRFTAGVNQAHNRLYSTEKATEEEQNPKDRSVKIPVETSIRYLKSRSYQATYGEEPVWVPYVRNFKGQRAPPKTRKTCIRKDRLVTNNPCPICRDEYLVLHETNVDLLKQFISPHSGEVLDTRTINLCRRQFDNLMISVLRARDQGLLTYDVPFRHYNYDHFKPKSDQQLKPKSDQQQEGSGSQQ